MNLLRHYKQIILLICLLGIVATAAMRITDITDFAMGLIDACMPLIVGFCMAFVLNIIVSRLERILWPGKGHPIARHARRPVAILLSIFLVALFIAFVVRLAVPQLAHSLGLIVMAIPIVYQHGLEFVNNHMDIIPGITPDTIVSTIQGQTWVGNLSEWGSKGGSYVVKTLGTAAEWVFNALIGLFFAVYILLDKEKLSSQTASFAKAYMSTEAYKRCSHWLSVAYTTFSQFFIGQFLDALVLGVFMGVTLMAFGVTYAWTIACVISLTGLIPMVGIYIGAVIGAIILLTVSPWETVVFLIILEVIHQIESNFIYPRIIGSSVGLPGLWVLAAVIVGGSLYGIAGMLIGVPLVATIYKLLQEDVRHRVVEKRGEKLL